MCWDGQGRVRSILLDFELVRRVVYYQILDTYVWSGLNACNRMPFSSRMKLLFTLSEASSLIWNDCFRIWGSEDIIERLSPRNQTTKPPVFFMWEFREIKMYRASIANLYEVQQYVRSEIKTDIPKILKKFWMDIKNRLHAVIRELVAKITIYKNYLKVLELSLGTIWSRVRYFFGHEIYLSFNVNIYLIITLY